MPYQYSAIIKTAKNMLKLKMDKKKITTITGLTKEELEKLEKEMDK